MELERRSIRVGLAGIAVALLLRLLGSGILEPVAAFIAQPEVVSFLVYLETGRVVRPEAELQLQAGEPEPTEEATVPSQPTQPPEAVAVFAPEEAAYVTLGGNCGYTPDLSALLTSDLSWDLTQDGPTVLILHSHATESYTRQPGQEYEETSAYRTLDERYNMIAIGERVAQILQAGGVEVIHDRTLHDYPSYSGAYTSARRSIRAYLEQYPTIRLVLDLHRDAATVKDGSQMGTAASVAGEPSAQLMMVVGTDAGGLNHPNWQENMALALKLHVLLERTWPGLCRKLSFRTQRFNQDLSPGGMLIEVGAAGDSLQEALTAAEALARSILSLAKGSA